MSPRLRSSGILELESVVKLNKSLLINGVEVGSVKKNAAPKTMEILLLQNFIFGGVKDEVVQVLIAKGVQPFNNTALVSF